MSSTTQRLVLVATLALGYILVISLVPADDAGVAASASILLSQAMCAVLLGRRALQAVPGRRAAWAWSAASAASSCVIYIVWLTYEVRGLAVPSPSLADAGYLGAVVLMLVAALLLRPSTRFSTDQLHMLLDGAVIAGALLLISWYLLLKRSLELVDELSLTTALLAAYPLFDVVAVAVVVILLSRSRGRDRGPLAWMASGILTLAASDTAFGILIIEGTAAPESAVTVGWVVGYVFIVFAAGDDSAARAVRDETFTHTRARLALLVTPAAIALGLTAIKNSDRPGIVAMAALGVLVLMRQTIAIYSELDLRSTLERRVEEQTAELRQQVYVDTVTGLGNRIMLRERAAKSELVVDSSALLLLDLDGFKEINDTLGHSIGDAVLTTLGHRLGGVTRQQDTVVRMGGDEFAVLLPETGRRAAMAAAHRVLEALREPVRIGDVEVTLTGSVGVALAGSGLDVDELIRRADLAMYEAKADGGDDAKVFDPQMHLRLQNRLRLEAEIREAIATGRFTVYYQPIVDTRSGEVACLEALLRWDHPDRGVLSPYEFLAVAERTGAIIELGNFVLRTACRQLAEWRADWPELRVAVNLSHRELLDPALPERVAAALAEAGLPGEALHLEVTETVLAADVHIRIPLDALVRRGVALSIDDFGTGHSSLSRIRELPAQRLKIDRSFIHEIQHGAAPLLESILALARSLEMTTVAEGVETEAQVEFLTRHGCDELQGYLFSRPVAAEHVIPVLFSTRSRSAWELAPDESPLPELVSALTGEVVDLHAALGSLLRELSFLTGLETTFVTTVDSGHQVTTHAHNGGDIAVPPGLSVQWDQTLCARLIEDDTLTVSAAQTLYGDVEAVRDLGIETYVSVPIRDTEGTLVGTLCAASASVQVVDLPLLSLMELFARVLSGRMGDLRSLRPESSEPGRRITAGP